MTLPIIKVQDALLDIVPRVYYAKQGPASLTHQSINANSFTKDQVRWSAYTPSVNVGVDTRMYVEYNIRFSLNSTANNAPTIGDVVSTTQGLRQYPVTSTVESANLKLNNSTISSNLYDMIHALHRYGTSPSERNHYMSGSPSYPDQFPRFDDVGLVSPGVSVLGSRNPFSTYTNNIIEVSRNMSVWMTGYELDDAPNDDRVVYVDFVFIEPVFLPTVNWTNREKQCLFGIQTIDLTYSHADLKLMFEGKFSLPGYDFLASSVDILTAPKLHLFYVSPQLNQDIPKLLNYPFYELGRYITGSQELTDANFNSMNVGIPLPANSTKQTTINNIQLQSIPKRIYIYVQQQKGGVDAFKRPNVWARINSISVNWNSVAGRLSTYTSYDLYRMSVKNGLDMSWKQWQRFNGGIICIEPPSDLGISPLEASGSRGSYQLQYQISYTNLQPVAVTYEVYTVAVAEGFMTINDSFVSQDVGVLTEKSIADAEWAPAGSFNEIRNLYGGGYMDEKAKYLKKTHRAVRGLAEMAAPVVGKMGGALADFAGSGLSGGMAKSGGRRAGPRGGAMSSARSLSSRAR